MCEEHEIPKLYLAAVEQNGNALEYVPDKFKTLELCFTAVQTYGSAFEYVPEKFYTPELCLAAVEQAGWKVGRVLEYVPKKFTVWQDEPEDAAGEFKTLELGSVHKTVDQ